MKKNIFLSCVLIFAIGYVRADEIDQLVANLSNTNRLWSWNSGGTLNLHLPETATTDDVIKQIFAIGLPKGQEANYKILEIRQVTIPNGLRPDIKTYTAAIVLKGGDKKIVLFAYWGGVIGWWNQVYDSKSDAIGHINLSMKDAKFESKFIWPTNRSPEIVMEYSDINAEPLLQQHHEPYVIQIEITNTKNGQMVVSNSIVSMDMFYGSAGVSVPSDTIRLDNYTNDFQAGAFIYFISTSFERNKMAGKCGHLFKIICYVLKRKSRAA